VAASNQYHSDERTKQLRRGQISEVSDPFAIGSGRFEAVIEHAADGRLEPTVGTLLSRASTD